MDFKSKGAILLQLLRSPLEPEEQGETDLHKDEARQEQENLLSHGGVECIGKQTGTV